jgi:DNA-nicking Smr family endonuclease
MARRPLGAEESALWARVIATVRPIDGRAPPPPPPTSRPTRVLQPPSAPAPMPVFVRGAAPKTDATLDGSWDRRLSRGVVDPDITIDLHGHTLQSAYAVLDAGLDRAIRSGARVMLLITGKPPRERPDGGPVRGAIRAAVGDWIASSRHAAHIAAVRGAHPRHGGAGALYIIMKRSRGSR